MKRESDLPELAHSRMSQSYLSLAPELRILRYEDLMHGAPDSYDLKIKSEETLAREEIIKDLTADEYRILLDMIGALPPIVKDYKTLDWKGHTLEYSVMDAERSGGFSHAEIEYPPVEEANAFVPPAWFWGGNHAAANLSNENLLAGAPPERKPDGQGLLFRFKSLWPFEWLSL